MIPCSACLVRNETCPHPEPSLGCCECHCPTETPLQSAFWPNLNASFAAECVRTIGEAVMNGGEKYR
jgi:hypothetical protein